MTRKVIEYKSPNNLMEQAIVLADIPEGVYKSKDKAVAEKYLAVKSRQIINVLFK